MNARLRYKLRHKYGLEVAQYLAMLTRQNNGCYICKVPFESNPQVDHNHTTGRVRKLLCGSCNQRVDGVEKRKAPSPHISRRYDRTPYVLYLQEHGDM